MSGRAVSVQLITFEYSNASGSSIFSLLKWLFGKVVVLTESLICA